MSRPSPYPFVKWLGGKARMTKHIISRLPKKIGLYAEPMVGGGAVFLELAREKRFEEAIISDSNNDLVCAWGAVQYHVDELVKELRSPGYEYDKKVFLKHREVDPSSLDLIKRAARFIYLNRTCFNGIYRVNSDGKFNTPFGDYKDPVICDEANLRAVSAVLKDVMVSTADFKAVSDLVKDARRDEFPNAVYFDPPYIPITKTANFTSYTDSGFSLDDHVRLADCMDSLSKSGARVVTSNSSADKAVEIFGRFDIDYVTGSRSVGGADESRKAVREMVVFAGPRT